MRQARESAALVVVAAGVVAALHVGKISPALPVLRDALGVSLVEAGFLLSLVQLAGLLLGLAVGLSVDALGLRRSMITGLLLLGGASLLGGWATEVTTMLALRALEGLGFLLVSMPAPSLIRQLVPPQRMSRMLGLWGAYMPLGTALALLAGPGLIALTGWSSWWWLLGAVALAMAIWVQRVVPAASPHGPTAAAAPGKAWPERLRQTLRAPGPWLVALCFAMYSAQWLAVIGFLPTIYAQAGLSNSLNAVMTAMVAAVNMVGNIASGRLLERGVGARTLLYVGFATMGVSTLVAFAPWTGPVANEGAAMGLRFVAVLLFSMVGGVIPGTLFSQAVRLAPSERTVSTTVGWVQQWSAIGQFAGPPLAAWVASLAGSWQWTWVVTGGFAALGLLLAGRMSQNGHARDRL